MKEFFDIMREKIKPYIEKINPIIEKVKPIKERLYSDKTASAFRITYSVIWNLVLIFLISIVLVAAMGAGVGAGYFASLVKDETPRPYESMKRDIYNYEEPSELYFSDGIHMGNLRSDIIREEVKLEDVSDYFIKAVIAVEDENFLEHEGVVPKAVLRALFQEVTGSSVQTGGSTLTQQLIKNQILTNEVSFERKAKEILLALRLENFFDKEEIMEAYINVSSFGRNASGQNIAGVQAAAQGIFGVDAKDLNLPQAAFIAGLPQSPNGYTPFTRAGEQKSEEGMQPGLNRQKTVLRRMYETGAITKAEYESALEYDIVKDFTAPQETVIEQYPFLSFEAEKRAKEILMKILYEEDGYQKEDIKESDVLYQRYSDLAIKNLRQNGYKIYTTIDKDIYDAHQKIVANFKSYGPSKPERKKDPDTGKEITVQEPVEVGAMIRENETGRIISFVGGRDFEREQTNHATNAPRPNGSTMKPLVVYGPAFDMGFAAPATSIADVDHGWKSDSGKPWPKNFSPRYYGIVSARTALKHSYNVSAVSLLDRMMQAGKDPFQYLEKNGLESLANQNYKFLRATALGSQSVTVEENTNAFATFANGGLHVGSYMIEKIEDKDGNVIYEHKPEPVKVFSPQAAYLTVDMMRDVVRGGTAASLPGYLKFSADFAGKTGTSQNNQDIWFVGLNPNVTMGIWMGYDTPKWLENRSVHLNLWAQLMNAVYEHKPELIDAKETFKMPDGIVRRTVCSLSGKLPSEACSKAGLTVTDYFIAEHVPTERDNSLIEGKYVTIGDKNYLALDSTPDEFSKSGFILNPDFIKEIAPNAKSLEQLIPDNAKWANIVIPDAKVEENGKTPAAPKISHSGNQISWKAHKEKDVIGYRVYRVFFGIRGEQVGSILASDSLSFKLPGIGQYAVTAVDIAGNESSLSNTITNGILPDPPGDDDGEDDKPVIPEPPEDDDNLPVLPIEPPDDRSND